MNRPPFLSLLSPLGLRGFVQTPVFALKTRRKPGASRSAVGLDTGFRALANEAEPTGVPFTGLANEIGGAAGDGWARVPYGEWPHEEGLQRFGKAEAEEMVRYFKNTWNTLKRAVTGLPIFRGHPDLADVLKKQRASLANEAARRALDRRIAEIQARWPDRREYGSIADMEARDDAFYLKPVLTPAGAALVNEGLAYFSPHWLGRVLGQGKGGKPIWGPAFLLSIGLTDRPNIGGTSLVNQQPTSTMNRLLVIQLLAALGRSLANEATDEQLNAELTAAAPIATALRARPEQTALANEQTARTNLESQLTTARAAVTTAETALANERAAHAATVKSRNETLVSSAIREGRVLEANRQTWLNRLERDFAGESAALANEAGAIKTQGKTDNLGDRKAQGAASSKFTALVNERISKTGESWDAAWQATKRTADGKAAYDEMSKPAASS